MTLLVSRF